MMRKRLWLAVVSVGWFAAAAGLGLLVSSGDLAAYILLLGVVLLLLLALPGVVMMRQARTSA